MAADVKVREIRLLEGYSRTYSAFMESSISMSYRFRAIIQQKDDEARDATHKIRDHVNIIQQKLTHAKNDLEAAMRDGGGQDGKEIEQRARAVEKYKKLYEKAQMYEENSRKLYQNVHAEVDRMVWMNNRFREKLEKSRDEGMNFLNKAISALDSYTQ
jgi:hypothetical protein